MDRIKISVITLILLVAVIALVIPTWGSEALAEDDPTVLPTLTETAVLLSPPQVPPPIERDERALVKVELETREVVGTLSNGVEFEYWTFNGTVPGPIIRVRQGDTVELTLRNAEDSKLPHSIDLHAVTGPGGGATVTQVMPGEAKTFQFKALNPGVFVYHCATPVVAHHIAQGMYGLIIVEPEQGFARVDKEFYVMQGEVYTQGRFGDKGLQAFDFGKMMDEEPAYVVFNGCVGCVTDENALQATVGETVRIYFGVGGPNLGSSFHIIGEFFDEVHQEGAAEAVHDLQTTFVPPGGATWVDFAVEVPGTYLLVDHSLARLQKGAAGHLVVTGPEAPHIFKPMP
ncbi:MAG: nitrite reductase, copper-containing [Chloroflexi bacterium]|nr:nitrite reductase, copper-containing [Chloroflexota bacterium]